MEPRFFASLSILIVIFTVLGMAYPVFADSSQRPEMFTFTGDGSLVLPPGEYGNPCSFEIVNHQYGTFRKLTWYNADGQWTEFIELYGNLKFDWTANGKSVRVNIQGPARYTVEYLPDRNVVTQVSNGTTSLFTIPGYAVVMGSAGRTVMTWTFTPDWQTLIFLTVESQSGLSAADADALCSYLAP